MALSEPWWQRIASTTNVRALVESLLTSAVASRKRASGSCSGEQVSTRGGAGSAQRRSASSHRQVASPGCFVERVLPKCNHCRATEGLQQAWVGPSVYLPAENHRLLRHDSIFVLAQLPKNSASVIGLKSKY